MRRETNKQDRWLLICCGAVFILTMAVLWGYQLHTDIREGNPYAVTEDMERKATVDGYETPEEVVEYVLYQIHRGDLDLALRGCAIQEVSEYFSLQSYGELLVQFPYSGVLAPADYDAQSYIGINQVRMTAAYSNMLEQCMGIFGDGYELEILNIAADIPEDADGYYFQAIRDIGSVTGAKDACNVVVDMLVEGVPRRLTVTAGKYKQHWKILQFSEYKNYQYTEPQISEYTETVEAAELPLDWEKLENKVLPCNYRMLASRSEEDVDTLARQLFLYLQRGDVWKAMAYFDIYDPEEGLYPDSIFYKKQSDAAAQLQDFYYRILLYDGDKMSWINQNVKTEAVNLVALLDTKSMIYANLYTVEIVEQGEEQAICKITYGYDTGWFASNIYMVYKDGWKITGIGPA